MEHESNEGTQANDEATHTSIIRGNVIAAATVLLIIATTAFISQFDAGADRARLSQQTAQAHIDANRGIAQAQPRPKDPFADLSLEARAAYVYDIAQDKVLYQSNPDARHPLASLAKLMTALVAHEEVPSSTTVTIGAEDVSTDGDTGLLVGEKWRLSHLIDYTLITSSNDGASAIAATVGSTGQTTYGASTTIAKHEFVREMNSTAEELGLEQTKFSNATGLDVSEHESGAYGSAREIGELLTYLVEKVPALVEASARTRDTITSLSGVSHSATNTNQTAPRIPGLIISKTGYTDLAGGNLAVVFDVGVDHPVVAVVLGSTYDGRFTDMETLVDAVFAEIGG